MSLNKAFVVKNDLNTLGRILSGGTDLSSKLYSPITLSTDNGNFTVSNGGTETFSGSSGITTSASGSTVTISGNKATTSSVGVASFDSASFSVNSNGKVSLANSLNSLTTTGTISSQTFIDAGQGFRYNGTATSGYFLKGNGTNFVPSTIQSSDVPTLNQNTSGSAGSLATSHTIWGQSFNGTQNITGDLSNVGNITGSGSNGITISTASNGNITLSPNGNGIVTTGASFQAASANITGNLSVGGSIYFGGSAIQIVQNELVVNEPIIYLANNNPTDTLDIGFVGHVNRPADVGYFHTGLLRSNPSTLNAQGSAVGTWYLFSSMVTEPSANSLASNSKVIDTLVANISGNITSTTGTFTNSLIVGSTTNANYNIYTKLAGSSTNQLVVNTFNPSSYSSVKYLVQVKNTSTNNRAAFEIIASNNNGTWDGTVYGIIDSSSMFSNVDISTSSTVDLTITFATNAIYSATVLATQLTD